jgi:hypothetical protein
LKASDDVNVLDWREKCAEFSRVPIVLLLRRAFGVLKLTWGGA